MGSTAMKNSSRFLRERDFSDDQKDQREFYETDVAECLNRRDRLSDDELEAIASCLDNAFQEGFFTSCLPQDVAKRVNECIEEALHMRG
jgi:hypothetical protein